MNEDESPTGREWFEPSPFVYDELLEFEATLHNCKDKISSSKTFPEEFLRSKLRKLLIIVERVERQLPPTVESELRHRITDLSNVVETRDQDSTSNVLDSHIRSFDLVLKIFKSEFPGNKYTRSCPKSINEGVPNVSHMNIEESSSLDDDVEILTQLIDQLKRSPEDRPTVVDIEDGAEVGAFRVDNTTAEGVDFATISGAVGDIRITSSEFRSVSTKQLEAIERLVELKLYAESDPEQHKERIKEIYGWFSDKLGDVANILSVLKIAGIAGL